MQTFPAFVALLAAALTACVTVDDVNDSMRKVDRVWQLEYQRTEDEFRYRVVDASYDVTFLAARQTFLDLGMPIQDRSIQQGVLVAENSAPTPLNQAEWLEVATAENARFKEMGVSFLRLSDDPKDYLVTVRATIRPFKGKTLVVLDYELDSPKIKRLGVNPSKHAPPAAVRIASVKFWASIEKRLRGVKAPPPRRRTKQELDA